MLMRSTDPGERVAFWAASTVAAAATVVLLGGWLLNVERLRTFGSHWSPMAPLTAVLFFVVSIAIIRFQTRPRLADALLLVATLGALAVLAEYLLSAQLGIQQLSNVLAGPSAPTPEVPAPDTVAAVLLLAVGAACTRTTKAYLHDIADVLQIVIGVVCLQVLIAYSYNIAQFSSFVGFRQIAPHSTVAVTLLALAVIAQRPSTGVFAVMTGDAQSASILRRLLPITVLFCIVVGWLLVLAIREQIGPSMPVVIAWTTTATVVVLALLLFVASGEMRRSEAVVQRRQQELEAAMIAAQAASEAKSRFMAVMSHELRTPLTAVIGYADLLDAGVAGPLSKEATSYLDRIGASGRDLITMIDAVLFYAGGKRPAEQVSIRNVDVTQLVGDIVEVFRAQSGDRPESTELALPEEALHVETDPAKLRQIMINLLSNAHKFTAHGRAGVRLYATADAAIIEVWDTGIGIAAADLPGIWEPFHLVDGSHTRQYGGMGLGLALTRQLTDELHARITVASVPGEGTTFTLELPRPVVTPAAASALDGLRVLVVDDEPSVLRLMAETLSFQGALVTEATSAFTALDAVAITTIDVVVTDISMPGMTGVELAQRLHTDISAPILFVTGAELDATDLATIDTLGGRLLRKPFAMDNLVRIVRSLAPSA